MTKIKKISVHNYKAVSEQEIELNGASIMVTAGNNKGKTSVLRGLIDRFRGEKPDIIVKTGEEKGDNTMELTDGSKIEWNFTEKSERFSFTTSDEIKMTTGVLSAIGKRYFGIKFDIDKFIKSTITEQTKQVQKLLGIDLSELDAKYKTKYEERTDANKEVKRLLAINKQKPEEVDMPDIDSLKMKKQSVLDENLKLKDNWLKKNEIHQKESLEFNNIQETISQRNDSFLNDWEKLKQDWIPNEGEKEPEVAQFIDFSSIANFYSELETAKDLKEVTTLPEPLYKTTLDIDKEIEEAYENKSKFDSYNDKLKDYEEWVAEGKKARDLAEKLDQEIEEIKQEKLRLVKEANLPEDFEMTDDGIHYKGLPLDDNQISSSSKYICALKLGSLVLGKLRTMHFDASYLDKNSLNEIQEWADSQDLQLLIERPDFEAGDITYQIVS